MYNKEALRKELMGAWNAASKYIAYVDKTDVVFPDDTNAPPGQTEWITTRLAALGDGQEGKGLRWVKANDQLPDRDKDVIVRSLRTNKVKVTRNMGHNSGWDISMDWDFKWDNTEWLDESAALPLADGEGEKPKIQTCPNCGSDADEIGDAGDGYYTCIYCGNRFPVRPSKPLLPAAVTGGVKWVELKEGNPLPDYDEPVLWLHEDGNMHVDALDKDGNPWIFGEEFQGFTYPKATHWMPLPHPPSEGQPGQGMKNE